MLLRRPPTLVEQVLGRKRARRARRRLGYLALGAGVTMLRPTMGRLALMTGGVVLCLLLLVH
jgi:hypothetical protein